MPKNNTILLIIGNGFDLQCGLESGYASFFEWMSSSKNRAEDNIWAIHFLNSLSKGQLWVDIESKLLNAINASSSGSLLPDTHQWHIKAGNPRNFIVKEIEYISNHYPKKEGGLQNFDYYWFLDELIKFERQFCAYLKNEMISKSHDYRYRAANLIKKLTNKEPTNIINFNYTDPFGKELDFIGKVINVHGKYKDNNIIFGVDNHAEKLRSETRIFTKTHRKMTMQGEASQALPKYVSEIKFYGHSLGSADYSYFQSIFDYYNLYGDNSNRNPVSLRFYFTIYDESKEFMIKRNATDSVYKLIASYGDTLDNKDKGKNLLHKLLLEGRVHIEFFGNL